MSYFALVPKITAITCSNSTIEIQEKGVKHYWELTIKTPGRRQWLNLNISNFFFQCQYCWIWIWIGECLLRWLEFEWVLILFNDLQKIYRNDFTLMIITLSRSSRPLVFCKKIVLENFIKFTRKHICQRFLWILQNF